MSIPHDRQYTQDHEWVLLDGDVAVVGITSYASDALGDVVYVELPEPGTAVTAGTSCGEIESTKSVSDLVAPASGEVLQTNAAAIKEPSVLNTDPYGEGWLLRLRVTDTPDLLDHDGYARLVGGAS